METFEEQKAFVARLNIVDDTFFHKIVDDLDVCTEILRILLNKPDLEVIDAQPQRFLRNLGAHSVILDLYCKDSTGARFNIEMQKSNDTHHQKRVRFNISNMDTVLVEEGTDYRNLPDIYVIFISTFDIFKENCTTYHIHRAISETGTVVENGVHEIYVNTKVDDGSAIAELMQYFKDSKGFHPKFKKLSERVHYLKETNEGVNEMCDIVEEYAQEKAIKHAEIKVAERDKETAIKMLKENIDISTIIKILPSFSYDELHQLQQEHLQNA